jgi:hypothetical protein
LALPALLVDETIKAYKGESHDSTEHSREAQRIRVAAPDNCVVTLIDLQPQMLFGVSNFDRQTVINRVVSCKSEVQKWERQASVFARKISQELRGVRGGGWLLW